MFNVGFLVCVSCSDCVFSGWKQLVGCVVVVLVVGLWMYGCVIYVVVIVLIDCSLGGFVLVSECLFLVFFELLMQYFEYVIEINLISVRVEYFNV